MKKQIGMIALAGLLMLVFVLATAGTAAAESGTCGAEGSNLTWTLDSEGTLTISGTGKMTNYNSSNRSPWGESIKTVIINNGVTSVGSYAFYNCQFLSSVTLPEGITTIGDNSFYECYALQSIELPESVISIQSKAFYFCTNLSELVIPDSIYIIRQYVMTSSL